MKVAVLIGSLLECTDMFIIQLQNMFSKGVDFELFIYTNKRYKDQVKIYQQYATVRAVKYIEDDPNELANQLNIKKLKDPSNIFQYFNLKKCFELAEASGIKYDIYYRIRPDIWKIDRYRIRYKNKWLWTMKRSNTEPFWTPDYQLSDHELYAKSDQFYMGTYNAMKKVSHMADYIFTHFHNINDFEYMPLNYDIISKSDMNSVRFDMLNYPSNLISQKCLDLYVEAKPGDFDVIEIDSDWQKYIALKNILKEEIKKNLDELQEIKEITKTVTSKSGSINRGFRAEKSFAYYVSSICNLIVRELPNIRNGG